ncbi:hypothetical protein BKA67DRAFT_562271 [Truncatella angustata]|uniref:MYND-type domain-containing protein n=1 Tax=Truncatella angustata TaxID=152316 RepID=A0A9P8UPX6_9PEZI|nr:uncharacterized protein BKA67DRAFT_562271 [Truncatella angustata]KAH6655961.1 hypothetical protein BKA67DRAFT_562271 [Truncatella angustata]
MPSFTNNSTFPTFYSLPTTTDSVESDREWYMVAQVKNNMTITKPTLIVTDKSGMDFAVTFEEDRNFDLKARGLKKGNTIVLPKARRLEKGPGRKDVLVIEKEDCEKVKAIPGSLTKTLELGSGLTDDDKSKACETCQGTVGGLMRCTGCETVVYCSKDCQVKGWSERGHKSDCKIFKSIREIWT